MSRDRLSEWANADNKVRQEPEAYLAYDENGCYDFVQWLAEEKGLAYYELVQEWIKTKHGGEYVNKWIDEAFEASKDPDDNGKDR